MVNQGGNREGLWRFYHSNGQLEKEGTYDNGGFSDLWEYYDLKGSLVQKEHYYKPNQIKENFEYLDVNSTLFQEYYTNGLLKEEGSFMGGKLDGKWAYFHENGQKSREGNYRKGTQVETWKFWFPKGDLIAKTVFEDGQIDSIKVKELSPKFILNLPHHVFGKNILELEKKSLRFRKNTMTGYISFTDSTRMKITFHKLN